MMKKAVLAIALSLAASAVYAQSPDSVRLVAPVADSVHLFTPAADSVRLVSTAADSTLVPELPDTLSQRPSANRGRKARKGGSAAAAERPSEWTDAYLDTVDTKKAFVLNDYAMVGIHYGVSFNRMSFNPVYPQTYIFSPEYYGVTVSKYGKLFNMYPNFGLEAGIFYGHEGYKFKENKETGAIASIKGATECRFTVVEAPLMAAMHIDSKYFKLVANLGIYAGYRLTVERIGENVAEQYRNDFIEDMDRRFDYGLRGALGFGVVFSPVEFHLKANLRYGWGTIYEPDWYSEYYYRFAYPFDLIVTGSVYIHLGRRTGKTNAALKKEAYRMVYGTE
ncbi:MAG: porin family protein [Bacteroidia bacterium]|nr:porin family protein [Bacteroidia bacterium]